jgi:hypothetical protein
MVKKYKKLKKMHGGGDFLDNLASPPTISSFYNPLTAPEYKEPRKPFSLRKPKTDMQGFETLQMRKKFNKPPIDLDPINVFKKPLYKPSKFARIKTGFENLGTRIKNGITRVINRIRGKGVRRRKTLKKPKIKRV